MEEVGWIEAYRDYAELHGQLFRDGSPVGELLCRFVHGGDGLPPTVFVECASALVDGDEEAAEARMPAAEDARAGAFVLLVALSTGHTAFAEKLVAACPAAVTPVALRMAVQGGSVSTVEALLEPGTLDCDDVVEEMGSSADEEIYDVLYRYTARASSCILM